MKVVSYGYCGVLRVVLFVLITFALMPLERAAAQNIFDSAIHNQTEAPVEVIRITPSGSDITTSGQQIVISFNQPMVATGQMQTNAEQVPVLIKPKVACQWRWLNTSSLACQLNRSDKLQNATHYTVRILPGFKSLNGAEMEVAKHHEFITQRPSVNYISLEEWTDIGKPIVRVSFNQPVTKASLLGAMRFVGNDARYVSNIEVPSAWNPLNDETYLKYAVQNDFVFQPSLPNSGDSAERRVELSKRSKALQEARNVWRVTLEEDLPENSKIDIAIVGDLLGIEGQMAGPRNPKVHQFTSLPKFQFIGIECQTLSDETIIQLSQSFEADINSREAKFDSGMTQSCDPLQRVGLMFTVPISNSSAGNFIRFNPDLAGGDENYDPWSTRNSRYHTQSFLSRRFNYADNSSFRLWVPEFLKAFEKYSLISKQGLQDEFGRELNSPMKMAFLTSHRRPALEFEHRHSVLETGVDSELPVYVTNLEQLKIDNYSLTTDKTIRGPFSFSKPLPKVEDVAYRVPVNVRDLLNGESGLVVGELSSWPMALKYGGERKYSFMSQVTPFQVHLKFGHFKSLAWVTSMATGLPVEGAQVSIELDDLSRIEPQAGVGSRESLTDRFGVVELPGLVTIDPKLTHLYAYKSGIERWVLKVRKGRDVAFLPVINEYRASAQIWPYLRDKDGHMRSWGTTAQGVYKAGDTIQYKFYVRGQSNRHWVAAPEGKYELSVIDPKGQVIETIDDIKLNSFGAFDGEVKISKVASVGWYDFKLKFTNEVTEHTQYPMRVLVSDFTPSAFKAGNDLNSDRFSLGEKIIVRSFANMHAGGPYTDAQARVTANLVPKQFRSDHPKAKGFRFTSSTTSKQTLHQSQGELNKQGELSTEFAIKQTKTLYGNIQVETAVRDDRGKFVASRSTAEFLGADKFLGLKQTSWVQQVGKSATVDYLVVDVDGVPIAGTPVNMVVEYRVTTAARVKGAGNAYLTQYTDSWVELSRCQSVSKASKQQCEFTPKQAGQHRVTASIKDSRDRAIENSIQTWAVGDGAVVWNNGNRDHIEIVPDKSSYALGDTAKFLIKNPYPGAQALITLERYGVLRSWQQTLKGSTPIIEVPISQDDYPGVYISVVVASPRVDKPLGNGDVDLGKPAFKMGYLKVDVRDGDKEINLKIRSDKKVYKPRDTVKVSLSAKPKTGRRKAMELAVVVLDEAVFDLNTAGKGYYDPLKGFNSLEQLGVANYNLLMRLVGRQRFEKKGANPGGGGGDSGADLRNLMKFVAYWNPSIELSKTGRADFEFDLPDNLTGWRVLALVVDKEDRMGLGDYNFKVNRPTELRPVMPNQLTSGDVADAGFSVMNRTKFSRSLEVELRASGSALSSPISKTTRVELAPFERKRVWISVNPDSIGEIAFYAKAGDSRDKDAIEHNLQVNPRYTIQSQATYGTTTQNNLTEAIHLPSGIVDGVGGVSVGLTPSVIGNISGAFRYMKTYPYACWEQRLSVGVAAAQYQSLGGYLPKDLEWPASRSLTQRTLDNASQFQASNGGMAYWINRDSYVSPYLSAYTALAFVWLREQGFDIPEQVENKLHQYLKGYLRNADAQQLFNAQLSIRSVALAALASRGAIGVDDLQRYQTHMPSMTLFAKAHFLQAATTLKTSDEKLLKIVNEILSQSVQSGGKFSFQESMVLGGETLLSSPARSNCSVLSALLGAAESSEAVSKLLADVPFKLLRSITQSRGDRDSWANTQENIFCMNALREFSASYENEAPNMDLKATFVTTKNKGRVGANDQSDRQLQGMEYSFGSTSFKSLRDQPVTLGNDGINVQAGLQGNLHLDKQGDGRYYYNVNVSFAKTDDSAERVNAGIEVRREYAIQREGKWQPLVTPMRVNKGELVRVDLFVSTSGPRHYVVVDDPVSGGLEPVNRDLATASTVDADQATFVRAKQSWFYRHDDWREYGRYGYSFYHQELRHDSVRFYSDYLPAGNYHLSYVAQVIASGDFAVKPLKVEEMYDPDVFGLGLPARLLVEPEGEKSSQ